jgi:stage II sporulation protein D
MSTSGGWGRRAVYGGTLDIVATPRGLRVVQRLDLEAYVTGVLAAEMPSSFPLEAMKAQAIAARTYTLQHLGGHSSAGADVCARVHCQAYVASPAATSAAAQAVRQTQGKILAWNEVLVDALYHAACGGATAPAWRVRQGKLLPYLAGRPDTRVGVDRASPYCAWGHNISWIKRFSHRELEGLVSANLGTLVGQPGLSPRRLRGIRLSRDETSGRAEWLGVYTDEGDYRVRGDAVRWLFGTGRPGRRGLRSTAFDMTTDSVGDARPKWYTFRGVGHGHGLGLCQWGSRGRAMWGQTAEEILADYYPGTTIVDLRTGQ